MKRDRVKLRTRSRTANKNNAQCDYPVYDQYDKGLLSQGPVSARVKSRGDDFNIVFVVLKWMA